MAPSKNASRSSGKYFTNHVLRLCLHLSCRSELDLDYDSYHEDYYDRYCQKATPGSSHALLLVCVPHKAKGKGAKVDSSSLLSPVVSAPRRCLPHSCQSSCLCCLLLLNSQTLTHRCTHTLKVIYFSTYRVEHLLWRHMYCGCTMKAPIWEL